MSSESNQGLIDKVVKIRRCAAVVKGGRRFSFAAMVVVGDANGCVAWGSGKAKEVTQAVNKAKQDGIRRMKTSSSIFSKNKYSQTEDGENKEVAATIPHEVIGQYGAAKVVLIPAQPGTGVIAGAAVRAVCEACGIHDILTKSYGSNNPINLVKATIDALHKTRLKEEIESLRGVELS